jgi:hypothetical protein
MNVVETFLRKLGQNGLKAKGMKVFEATWDGRKGDEAQLFISGEGKKYVIRTFLEHTRSATCIINGDGYFQCVIRPYGDLSRRNEITSHDPLVDHFVQQGADDIVAQHYTNLFHAIVGSLRPHEIDLPSASGKLVFDSKNMKLYFYLPDATNPLRKYTFSMHERSLQIELSKSNFRREINDPLNIPQDFIGAVERMFRRTQMAYPDSPIAQITESFHNFLKGLKSEVQVDSQ